MRATTIINLGRKMTQRAKNASYTSAMAKKAHEALMAAKARKAHEALMAAKARKAHESLMAAKARKAHESLMAAKARKAHESLMAAAPEPLPAPLPAAFNTNGAGGMCDPALPDCGGAAGSTGRSGI